MIGVNFLEWMMGFTIVFLFIFRIFGFLSHLFLFYGITLHKTIYFFDSFLYDFNKRSAPAIAFSVLADTLRFL